MNPSIARQRAGSLGLAMLLAVVTGLAAACGSGGGKGAAGFTGQFWVLDGATSDPAIDAGATVTLRADSGRVSGQAPCNAYNAAITVDGDSIEVGRIATSRMACDPATAKAETTFLQALGRVDAFNAHADRLTLTGTDVDLVFDAPDFAATIVGTWEVVNLAAAGALSTPLPGTTPTITFADDGTLDANAGCNQIGGNWRLVGASITIADTRRTEMACQDPVGVMEQEAALAAALERAARVEIADQLTIFDGDENTLIVADRVPAG